MESLDIALKGIKAVFIYNMLREGVPKSNGIYPLGHLIFCITCIVLCLFYGLIGISILMTGAYL